MSEENVAQSTAPVPVLGSNPDSLRRVVSDGAIMEQKVVTPARYGTRSEMEERVRLAVDGIYGDALKQHRRLGARELRRSESVNKMLLPARSEREKEIVQLVRARAEEYMKCGEAQWTDQVVQLREYYLKLLSGDTFKDDDIIFDNKAGIGGDTKVIRREDLRRDGLK